MMIRHIDTRPIEHMTTQAKPDFTGQPRRESDTDVTLEISYKRIIDQALAAEQEADTQAIQQAKQALVSGQWDSPDNIRKTAMSLLQFDV